MLTLAEADAQLTAPGAEFEIGTETIRGIETRVWANAPPTLREVLEASRGHGTGTFLVYEEERLSFEEHYRAAAAMAKALRSRLGVIKGDRVAVAMRNYPEFSIAFWAVTALGAIAVPLNAWWQGEELRYGLADSGSRVLIADGERLERLTPYLKELELGGVVSVRADAGIAEEAIRWESVLAESLEVLERSLAERGEESSWLPEADVGPEDDATIFYTSGTTGFPKGALGTHRNIITNLCSSQFLRARAELITGVSPDPDVQPASLLSVPLFHVTGCHSTMVPALASGSKLVLVYRFDPEETLRLIERERITSFGGVPTLVWKVLESPAFGDYDLSSVTRVGYGGAPAAPELVRRIGELFPGASPSNGYGLTETSALTTNNAGEAYKAKPTSVGRPVPVCTVKVVGGSGEELALGQVGELWIKGPNVIKGYWNKPEATAETFTDGWLHTGDVARVDEEGFVYIVDRAKDMVIRGGENVYCVEVESALFDHPDVIDAAVFGLPDRVLGEEVAAVVQTREGVQLDFNEIRRWLEPRLASFKIPSRLEVTTQHFPRNANGKTMKRTLRALMMGGLGIEEAR